MPAKCTPMTHEWTNRPNVDPMSGLRDLCSNCGARRFGEARVYELEQHAEKLVDFVQAGATVIESFKPLAHAAKAIADDGWPTLASNASLPASLEARLMTLKRAYEDIAEMVENADAESQQTRGKE